MNTGVQKHTEFREIIKVRDWTECQILQRVIGGGQATSSSQEDDWLTTADS